MAKQWIEQYYIVHIEDIGYISRMHKDESTGLYMIDTSKRRKKAARYTSSKQLYYARRNARRQYPGFKHSIYLKRTKVKETSSRLVDPSDIQDLDEQVSSNGLRNGRLWEGYALRA